MNYQDKQTKRILIHSNYNPVNSHGGIEVVVKQLWDVCEMEGYSVTCICGDDNSSNSIIGNVEILARRILFKLGGAPFLALGNWSLIKEARKSDLIIFQEPYPFLWPAMFTIRLLWRTKTIVLIHADPSAPKVIKKLYHFLRSIVFQGGVCVSTSPNVGNRVFSKLYSSCNVIPLAVPDINHSGLPTKIFDLPERYALYIGRLAAYKGIETILRAAELTPHINYVIAGRGPLATLVGSQIVDNELKNIYFIGEYIEEDDKEYLIEKSQFLLFPSISDNEAFGLVQLEAMRAGKPIINTDLDTGVNFVAPHLNCAITVKKLDHEDLARAVKLLWQDEVKLKKFGENARNRFLGYFDLKKFICKWKELINKSMGGSPQKN